jgi:hypothetical protein
MRYICVALVLAELLSSVRLSASDSQISNGIRYVASFAAGGKGTQREPWTGWEAAVTQTPCSPGSIVHFNTGYYTTTQLLNLRVCPITIEGEGSRTTTIVFTAHPARLVFNGVAFGGAIRSIGFQQTDANTDTVEVRGMTGFRMDDVFIQGSYNNQNRGSARGLLIGSGTNSSSFRNVHVFDFPGDCTYIDAETAGNNTFSTLWNQGCGGYHLHLTRQTNRATGGGWFFFDAQSLGVPHWETLGAFNFDSPVKITTQAVGVWCMQCVSDGITSGDGFRVHNLPWIYLTQSWIKSLAPPEQGGTAISFDGAYHAVVEGGFAQSSSNLGVINLLNGAGDITVRNVLISDPTTGAYAIHSDDSRKSGNSFSDNQVTTGLFCDNAASAGLTGPVLAGGTPGALAGQLAMGTNSVTTASPGGEGSLPGTVLGYLVWNLGGRVIKIPYYAN